MFKLNPPPFRKTDVLGEYLDQTGAHPILQFGIPLAFLRGKLAPPKH